MIVSKWIGREIPPVESDGSTMVRCQKVLTKLVRYPGFPLQKWSARSWQGKKGLSDTIVELLNLIIVPHNQAAVISDP